VRRFPMGLSLWGLRRPRAEPPGPARREAPLIRAWTARTGSSGSPFAPHPRPLLPPEPDHAQKVAVPFSAHRVVVRRQIVGWTVQASGRRANSLTQGFSSLRQSGTFATLRDRGS
jgi:hypothetical protein